MHQENGTDGCWLTSPAIRRLSCIWPEPYSAGGRLRTQATSGFRSAYKRVRAADNDVWRLRVAGFSRERAAQICQAVAEMGGACEVGPK